MPRRRRPVVREVEGEVPAALLDIEHEVWQTQAGSNEWRDQHRLSRALVDSGSPMTRHMWAVQAWAEQQLITAGPWQRVDQQRLAELGIPYSPAESARERHRLIELGLSGGRAHD